MKTLSILLIAVVIGYGQGRFHEQMQKDADSVHVSSEWLSVGKLVEIKHTVEDRVDTSTVNVVYDSLGYLKIAKAFRIGYYQITRGSWWSTAFIGYDSTIYIKDGVIVKNVIMEIRLGKK